MKVRPAVQADAPLMALVHTESWHDAYSGLLPSDLIASLTVERRTEQWERTINSDAIRCWVVLVEDEVAGLCAIGPSPDDPEVGQISRWFDQAR